MADVYFLGPIIYEVRTSELNREPETVREGARVEHAIGGGAPITAMALSELGKRAGIVSSVSRDSIAMKVAEDALKSSGIELRLERHPAAEMDTTITEQLPDGRKTLTHASSSYGRLTPEHIQSAKEAVSGSKVFMVQAFRGLTGKTVTALADLFGHLAIRGVTTALDLGAYASDPGINSQLWQDFLPNTRLIAGNEKEIYWLVEGNGKLTDPADIEAFMVPERLLEFSTRIFSRSGVQLVNIHYGEGGTMLVRRRMHEHHIPNFHPDYIRPAGTGNWQNAGIICASLLEGRDDSYAAKFANAAAGLWLAGKSPTRAGIEAAMT